MIKEATSRNYEYEVFDTKRYLVDFDGTPHAIGTVNARGREEAFKTACCQFAHIDHKHIMVAHKTEDVTTEEAYVYDIIDVKGKRSPFHNLGNWIGKLGMVGARSRKEAYHKACARFCKTGWFAHPKPKDIFVAIRSEVNYKPAETCLTVQGLREYQGGLPLNVVPSKTVARCTIQEGV